MKKGFSLVEIIFVLLILAIITTVAVSKFETTLDKANISKIKSDVLQIRSAINLYKNKLILKNQNESLDTLDDNDKMLFNIILDTPIIASNETKTAQWSKLSTTKYKVYIDTSNFVEFQYDTSTSIFDCDIDIQLCKELEL